MSFRQTLRRFGWFGKSRRPTNRPGKSGPPLAVEPLEDRRVPTTTLYLNFGETFYGGGMTITVQQLRDTLNGPDLTSEGLADTDKVTFSPLSEAVNFEYDGDLTDNRLVDANTLERNVQALVQRYYAPFDVDV